jgi:hypothetical protein
MNTLNKLFARKEQFREILKEDAKQIEQPKQEKPIVQKPKPVFNPRTYITQPCPWQNHQAFHSTPHHPCGRACVESVIWKDMAAEFGDDAIPNIDREYPLASTAAIKRKQDVLEERVNHVLSVIYMDSIKPGADEE